MTTAHAAEQRWMECNFMSKVTMQDIGRRLRLMADERKVDAKLIALLIECEPYKIEDVFMGKRFMRFDHLEMVCELLGITPEELLAAIQA